MAAPDQLYRGVTRLFSVVIIGFGAAIIVVTLAQGGDPLSSGLWIGALFVAIGVLRLIIAVRSRD